MVFPLKVQLRILFVACDSPLTDNFNTLFVFSTLLQSQSMGAVHTSGRFYGSSLVFMSVFFKSNICFDNRVLMCMFACDGSTLGTLHFLVTAELKFVPLCGTVCVFTSAVSSL